MSLLPKSRPSLQSRSTAIRKSFGNVTKIAELENKEFLKNLKEKKISTQELTAEVDRMLAEKIIVKVMEGNKYFYNNVPDKQIFPRNFTKIKV